MTGTPLLDSLIVLDFSQFLSGPLAALRLGDFGARVIKIERPDGGDLCRRLYLSDTEIGGETTQFHAINRGKESFAADLKNPLDMKRIKALIARADVMIQNFRPGVIQRLSLDYDTVRKINPRIVNGSITGYGDDGPWDALPGQDLLAQARSGLMWLNGDKDQGPVPFGLAVADRGVTGAGCHIETSLLEALLDLQFEVLATHMNDGGRAPNRSKFRNAHAFLAAPYGVYQTVDGWMALAMMSMSRLAALMNLLELAQFSGARAFSDRDLAKQMIAARLSMQTTAQWLALFEPADLWCAEVLDWPALLNSDAMNLLEMVQSVKSKSNHEVKTTRLPLRIDGKRPISDQAAPAIGKDTVKILNELFQPG